ncbi:Pyranose dehydrogenase [Eumeta japonica]|uniref:Pyranose dehydrogenase n=1 Tax=Eumeta variegata TaxID=151549 RepID=A0A4C1VY43_EUMVA|nr:Pyranose dehydrogenase [Eumeta japonica]
MTIYHWYVEFRRGRAKQSKTVIRLENVAAMQKVTQDDRNTTHEQIRETMNIEMTAVHTVLYNKVGVRKLISRWVSTFCTQICILERFNERKSRAVYNFVSDDGSWIHLHESERKHRAATWVFEGEVQANKKYRASAASLRKRLEAFLASWALLTSSSSAQSGNIVDAVNGFLRDVSSLYDGEPADADVLRSAYDFIIVGAGTAGCVLANRLTEVHHFQVLLVEAGDREQFFMDIPLLASMLQFTDANWDYSTEPQYRNGIRIENETVEPELKLKRDLDKDSNIIEKDIDRYKRCWNSFQVYAGGTARKASKMKTLQQKQMSVLQFYFID